MKSIFEMVNSEMKNLSSKETNSVLRRKAKADIQTFSLASVTEEWQQKAPLFLNFLEACVSNPSHVRNKV